jgi:hypothetical protein
LYGCSCLITVLCVSFCILLFIPLSFFFWTLYCLSVFLLSRYTTGFWLPLWYHHILLEYFLHLEGKTCCNVCDRTDDRISQSEGYIRVKWRYNFALNANSGVKQNFGQQEISLKIKTEVTVLSAVQRENLI